MKNKEVCKEFICRRVASGSNLISTGDKLFSYNTCIAQWYPNGVIYNETKYSSTTSRHQSYLKSAITHNIGWERVVIIDNINFNTRDLISDYERVYM